jgi:hypothetical protein
LLDHVQPLEVLLRAPVQSVVELRLHHACDLAGLAQVVVVDLPHRDQLGGGAGEKDLFGQVELRARDVPLDDRVAEVAGDLDD